MINFFEIKGADGERILINPESIISIEEDVTFRGGGAVVPYRSVIRFANGEYQTFRMSVDEILALINKRKGKAKNEM